MMIRLYSHMLLAVLMIASAAPAILPPPPLPLAERVKMSTHIFVGEIRDVYFISKSGKKISPRQAAQQMDYFSKKLEQASGSDFDQLLDRLGPFLSPVIETKIRVRESLLWRTGDSEQVFLFRAKVPSTGYYQPKRRARGFAEILKVEKQNLGKKFVLLTNIISQPGRRTYFVSSYGWAFREEMKQKAAVQKAIKQLESTQQ